MIFIDPTLDPAVRKKQLTTLVETLQSLFSHPGYRYLEEYYKTEESQAYLTLQSAQTGDMAMKAAGAYVAIKNIRELPKSYLSTSIEQLKLIR